jgi:hypothetical protein
MLGPLEDEVPAQVREAKQGETGQSGGRESATPRGQGIGELEQLKTPVF